MSSRSQSSATNANALALAPAMALSSGFFVLMPVMGFAAPAQLLQALPAAPPAAPAPAAAAAAAPAPAAARLAPHPSRAGKPLGWELAVLTLCGRKGPFLANEVFSIAPPQPLEAVKEEVPAPEWYAITRGRFVGVVDQYALADVAVTGVSQNGRKAYTTQSQALDAFNKALTWGGVQVM
ncbi:hypothetical protein C8F04DRAFT_1187723 [Mycena alexandri]|uniref:Uncharacterized protein n=1 Tax=Mycena alexandri TaxID=1745969 RepID=A0AAD6WYN4_9AGAR|nr:hypothetical protein C8F04DRAFT_1187723 [Mycena alexandri]